MTPEEFSKELIERYDNCTDTMINLIVKYVDELGIEMENIQNYLTPSIVSIMKEEATKLNLIHKTPDSEKTYDIF